MVIGILIALLGGDGISALTAAGNFDTGEQATGVVRPRCSAIASDNPSVCSSGVTEIRAGNGESAESGAYENVASGIVVVHSETTFRDVMPPAATNSAGVSHVNCTTSEKDDGVVICTIEKTDTGDACYWCGYRSGPGHGKKR